MEEYQCREYDEKFIHTDEYVIHYESLLKAGYVNQCSQLSSFVNYSKKNYFCRYFSEARLVI